MEVIVAYSDYQFFFYRNMIYIGVDLGYPAETTRHCAVGDTICARSPLYPSAGASARNRVPLAMSEYHFHCPCRLSYSRRKWKHSVWK